MANSKGQRRDLQWAGENQSIRLIGRCAIDVDFEPVPDVIGESDLDERTRWNRVGRLGVDGSPGRLQVHFEVPTAAAIDDVQSVLKVDSVLSLCQNRLRRWPARVYLNPRGRRELPCGVERRGTSTVHVGRGTVKKIARAYLTIR